MAGTSKNASLTPGIHNCIHEPDGLRYTIKIPDSYTGVQNYPCILILHWGGLVTPFYGQGILVGLVDPALGELDSILVAPDCPLADWSHPGWEEQVIALLDHLCVDYRIDRQRVLILGYSMGGIGTWNLVVKYPKKFAGALPISAAPPKDVLQSHVSTPFYVIHSRRDEVFPFDYTKEVVESLVEMGSSITFVPLEDATHFDTAAYIVPLRNSIPWIKTLWGNQ